MSDLLRRYKIVLTPNGLTRKKPVYINSVGPVSALQSIDNSSWWTFNNFLKGKQTSVYYNSKKDMAYVTCQGLT